MYTLFYILAYLAAAGFVCLAILKIRAFMKTSPLHVRWELYPIPHEGPKRAAYGGSYMEETNWWTKPRHVDHWMDLKAMGKEIFFLESTFEHNLPLWIRTYPFHMGLYMLMGGIMLSIFAAFIQVCGVSPENGFMIFLGNILNAMVLFGSCLIAGGGLALIARRSTDKGLHKYTTKEMYCNLGAFVVFGLLSLCAWVFNPDYFALCRKLFYNLMTCNFKPLGSGWFVLNMLWGFGLMCWIPVTNMRHILIKYFMYHDIRWDDVATVWSDKNKDLINENLQFGVTWSAPHVTEDGKAKNWVEVATANPADDPKDSK